MADDHTEITEQMLNEALKCSRCRKVLKQWFEAKWATGEMEVTPLEIRFRGADK